MMYAKALKALSLSLSLLLVLSFTTCSDSGGSTAISKSELSDLEAVEADASSLEIGYSGDDSENSITQSLTLPTTGSNGTTITWVSDTPGVIAVDGTVTRPEYGNGDVIVILTATIKKGNESDTKIFILTVIESEPPAGTKFNYTAGSVTFKTVYVPGGLTFPTGTGDSGEASITDAYEIGETEATNELVREVFQWAYDNGKFSETGAGISSATAVYGGEQLLDLDGGYIQIGFAAGVFSVDSGFEKYPVVEITWYGSVIFCNWLTEMMDGNTDNLVYSNIDSAWADDETLENTSKTGFRLLSSNEFEAAARYIGTVNPGYGLERPPGSGMYWTPGAYASGAAAVYSNAAATGELAWYTQNSTVLPNSNFVSGYGTHPVGTAGNAPGDGTPLTGNANQFGIFDMSGNVFEWCFTEYTGSRVLRGGSWSDSSSYMQAGTLGLYSPSGEDYFIGFRFSKSHP